MDSLTHIALGACIGDAFFEKGYGKKAMVWGALAQSIPDIDFIASSWLSPSESLLAHRGITHSLLFAVIVAPLFALAAKKIHHADHVGFNKWLLFFLAEIFCHLFIDAFNNYGVGWLEPFSQQRFSFNAIYVADIFFSLWPGIALVALIVLDRNSDKRKFWRRFGIVLPTLYLCYCVYNKIQINKASKEIFAAQQIPYNRFLTTPAPFQNWLWFVVAGNDSGYYAGFRSVFDTEKKIRFRYVPKNGFLAGGLQNNDELNNLIRFSQNFYTLEKWKDTLVFNDLRFGQNFGWETPTERFVFHYYLDMPGTNTMVVQRGRFLNWNKKRVSFFWKRIKGN